MIRLQRHHMLDPRALHKPPLHIQRNRIILRTLHIAHTPTESRRLVRGFGHTGEEDLECDGGELGAPREGGVVREVVVEIVG